MHVFRVNFFRCVFFGLFCILLGCSAKKPENPRDPYENLNRKIYKFNKAVDATMFKPIAKVYKSILPPQAHNSVNNFFNNLQLLPTVANDILQGSFLVAYKDTWRLLINTTFGLGGLFDVAKHWGLPHHSNDLGITLAKWGDTDSPYFVFPILGPTTFRDTAGLWFDFSLFSVYPHIYPERDRYALMGLRYIDLRADLLDKEALMDEALDEYSFLRDAYLQNRQYQISGDEDEVSPESIYIDDEEDFEDFDDDDDSQGSEKKDDIDDDDEFDLSFKHVIKIFESPKIT